MSFRTEFSYDSRSNLTCVLDPDSGLTYYTYDAGNRMTSVKNPFGEVTYYEHNPSGQMTRRLLGNGAVTYYTYDAVGQTTKVDNRTSGLTAIASCEYERDAVGNPESIVREDGYTTYYEYDAKHQLTGELQRDDQGQDVYAWAWDYDAAGNRMYQTFNGVTTYYSYNAANELLTEATGAETTYYHYDGCGNTVAKRETAGTTYYAYDTENLLTRIDFAAGGHNYYTYDADSKRVSQQDSDGFREFIYQGPDMLALQMERDESETTVAQYTMGDGLEAMRRSGTSSFYHYNHLGTTLALTGANEAVTDTYFYNAWGEVLNSTGATVNPHTYVGQQRYYRMPTADLYHLGFRDYAQGLGRFTTVDPARDGRNWFIYALQCAPAAADPSGLAAWRDDKSPWTDEYITMYHNAAAFWLQNAYRAPEKWRNVDCADFAMTMLVDIASRFSKRVCLFNFQRPAYKTNEYNSTDNRYFTPRQYLTAVKRAIGAIHLEATNTQRVSQISSVRAGDMFINASHTRVILSIYASPEKGDLMVDYYATDPGGPLEFKTKTFHNAQMGDGPRRWAFKNFFDPWCCDKS